MNLLSNMTFDLHLSAKIAQGEGGAGDYVLVHFYLTLVSMIHLKYKYWKLFQ